MSTNPQNGLPRYQSRVDPDWLDYNGHMNVAYYTLVFDKAGEAWVESVGMGEAHTRETGYSWMVAEAHITYQNEVRSGEQLEVETRVLAVDDKRIHLFQTMFKQGDTGVVATNEQLILHVDLHLRRVQPFPAEIYAKLRQLWTMQDRFAPPVEAGRSISMASRRPKPTLPQGSQR